MPRVYWFCIIRREKGSHPDTLVFPVIFRPPHPSRDRSKTFKVPEADPSLANFLHIAIISHSCSRHCTNDFRVRAYSYPLGLISIS